jgi:hypothetical protein
VTAIDFTPPRSTRAKARQRRNRILSGIGAGLAVLLVVAGVWWGKPMLANWSCGSGLWKGTGPAPECVGVSDSSAFDLPQLEAAQTKIADENRRVLTETPQRPVVTVALLTPVPVVGKPGSPSPVSPDQIRDKIEGAAVAQRAINTHPAGPEVRLVVANEGSQEQEWADVVERLKEEMTNPKHPLVAVTGLGVSIEPTLCGARSLSDVDLPLVSSVLTADGLNAQGPLVTKYPPQHCGAGGIEGLFRVSPSNSEEVEALATSLRSDPQRQDWRYMPVTDSNNQDFYTYGLQQDFERSFGGAIDHNVTQQFTGDADRGAIVYQLDPVKSRICDVNGVLYSGRASMLPDFVQALGDVDCIRKGRQITVVTGSDASSLDPRAVPNNVHVVYAALADPAALASPRFNPDGVARFQRFQKEFADLFPQAAAHDLRAAGGHLRNGWAIMQYDAMMAIDAGIDNATGGDQTKRPAGAIDVRGGIEAVGPRDWAGDSYTFRRGTGEPQGRAIHIVEINDQHRCPVAAYVPGQPLVTDTCR